MTQTRLTLFLATPVVPRFPEIPIIGIDAIMKAPRMVDWDKRYSQAEASGALFGRAPNNYLLQTLIRPDFTPKSALCLADGTGRNGRYLAAHGIDVTAIDLSTVGTDIARRLDAEAKVDVTRFAADLANWQLPAGQLWDAVFLIYLHCERAVREHAIKVAVSHLAPGGWFVAEGFAIPANDGPRMGPSNNDLLYTVADFDDWLANLEVMESLTGTIRLQEGARHQGLAQVVRYAARRSG